MPYFKPGSLVYDTSHRFRFGRRIFVCSEENDSTTSGESECESENEEIVEEEEEEDVTGRFGDTPPSG